MERGVAWHRCWSRRRQMGNWSAARRWGRWQLNLLLLWALPWQFITRAVGSDVRGLSTTHHGEPVFYTTLIQSIPFWRIQRMPGSWCRWVFRCSSRSRVDNHNWADNIKQELDSDKSVRCTKMWKREKGKKKVLERTVSCRIRVLFFKHNLYTGKADLIVDQDLLLSR